MEKQLKREYNICHAAARNAAERPVQGARNAVRAAIRLADSVRAAVCARARRTFMADPKGFFFTLPTTQRPTLFRLMEERVPDYQWYDQHRATTRIYHPINGIEAVVIHATSGYATQHALDAWRSAAASAHWIVPDEDEPQHGQFIWSVVSESLAAYHVLD